MKMFSPKVFLFAFALALAFLRPPAARARGEKFEVQRVAEGVYAVVRREPLGLWFEANNVLIVNDEDVVVVDSNISPAATREVIGALRKITAKPVRYVVNTHWHEDHVIGNQAWREAYPAVEFVGHASTLRDFPAVGLANRKQAVEGGASLAAMFRKQIAEGRSLADGAALAEEERAGYAQTADLIERYVAESPAFRVVLPTLTVEDRLTLVRGARTIEIRHLGRGHTGADLVVYLPKESIVVAGDLVVWPVPLVGTTSHPAEFAAALEKLIALKPAVIIPGHGPVMRDDSHPRLVARLLNSIREQTEAAVKRGETLEQARKSVNLDEFRKALAGDSQLRAFVFHNYVTLPAVAAAYRQAAEKR
ncbi:MAG TPA: MBL fold metallo-hydrolase [Pyrinomonadaceae bacterium]